MIIDIKYDTDLIGYGVENVTLVLVKVEGEGASSSEKGVEQGHGARQGVRQRLRRASDMGEGEPWMLLAMFGHTYYPLLIVNLLI